MNHDAKFVHDAVAEVGHSQVKDMWTMMEGLDSPQYIRSEQGEHTALHQVGPVVTQITVCDYTHADKVLDTQ